MTSSSDRSNVLRSIIARDAGEEAGTVRLARKLAIVLQPMIEKLAAMRLTGMVDALKTQEQDPLARERSFSVEEIGYRTARGLDKSVIRSLTQESAWAGTHKNIFLLGPTGVGKSFVACALAQKACRDGYSALYNSCPNAIPRSRNVARRW